MKMKIHLRLEILLQDSPTGCWHPDFRPSEVVSEEKSGQEIDLQRSKQIPITSREEFRVGALGAGNSTVRLAFPLPPTHNYECGRSSCSLVWIFSLEAAADRFDRNTIIEINIDRIDDTLNGENHISGWDDQVHGASPP